MRFIYRWHDEVIDTMPKSIKDKLEAAELASPLNVPDISEAVYAKIWWVPQADVEQFRYTLEYVKAKEEHGQVFEFRALIEHSGQMFPGSFFVAYDHELSEAA